MNDMEPTGPIGVPGVRYVVKCADGSDAVAFMTMGRRNLKDGTWLAEHGRVDAVEIVERYYPRKVKR